MTGTLLFRATGAEAQNRTGDTRIFSPLLYRLSYLGTKNRICLFEGSILVKAFLDTAHIPEGILKNGTHCYGGGVCLEDSGA